MMKLKVLKKFHDKETDDLRNAGDIIEVSDKRGKEILASKMNVAELLEVGEPDNPQSDSEGEPENQETEKLEDLTVDQLKAKAKELGIEIKKLKTKEQFLEAIQNKK